MGCPTHVCNGIQANYGIEILFQVVLTVGGFSYCSDYSSFILSRHGYLLFQKLETHPLGQIKNVYHCVIILGLRQTPEYCHVWT